MLRLDESFILAFEVTVHHPEEPLHYRRVASAVGIREGVEVRGGDAADAREFLRMDFRDVDKLVKTEDMKELTEHQQIHLRSVRQLSCLDLFVLHQFGNLVSLNIAIDYLLIA